MTIFCRLCNGACNFSVHSSTYLIQIAMQIIWCMQHVYGIHRQVPRKGLIIVDIVKVSRKVLLYQGYISGRL